MLGQLKWQAGAWGGGQEGKVYGLPVLRAAADPEGAFAPLRLRRAGRILRRGGVRRVLTPDGFSHWSTLSALGLAPVSPEPLLRFKAADLALTALERMDLDPERAAVALRGERVDRDMTRAALILCPRVRRLIISARSGGDELALMLRREYGVPVLPPEEAGTLSLRFSPRCRAPEQGLELWGQEPELGGLALCAPALLEEDRRALPLLTALWQGGFLREEQVKILVIS